MDDITVLEYKRLIELPENKELVKELNKLSLYSTIIGERSYKESPVPDSIMKEIYASYIRIINMFHA